VQLPNSALTAALGDTGQGQGEGRIPGVPVVWEESRRLLSLGVRQDVRCALSIL
jgi:hypothetical protein